VLADVQGAEGVGLALLGAAFLLGLRHGVDWDHIAAITDITASQESPRSGFRLGSLYVLAHAVVVLALGVTAIALGATLPDGIDRAMGRFVGVTLIVLGVYVVYSLVRFRGRFRMRSRWMLAIVGVRRAVRSLWMWRGRQSAASPSVHDHEHAAAAGLHHEGREDPARGNARAVHSHPHRHDEVWTDYTAATSLGVGALHGIGAETPTQVVVFLAAANAGGVWAGVAVLVVFLGGLILANTAITLASSFGFLAAGRSQVAYVAMGAVTGVASLVVGVLFVAGADSVLPAFFAG